MLVKQLFVDAYGCNGPLNDATRLLAVTERGVRKSGATVLASVPATYQPHGVTVAIILAESHVVVSTWPEFSFCAVDILLCGRAQDARAIWTELSKFVRPSKIKQHTIRRVISVADVRGVASRDSGNRRKERPRSNSFAA